VNAEIALPNAREGIDAEGAALGVLEPASRVSGALRVGLVDDHHLVREGVRLLLAGVGGIEIVGEAATQAEARDLVALTHPDVLLLDLTFAEGDGMPLIRLLRSRHPSTRILVLTMHRSAETVRQAFMAGASGFIVKGAHAGELLHAVRAVGRGERYLHSSVTDAIVEDSIRWQHGDGRITDRQREILSLVAAGVPAAEVARTLGISVFTVRRHIANLSAKLGLHGITALVRYAIQHDLVREG
jgi:DNA-binding NarL/FixJ family response regulator